MAVTELVPWTQWAACILALALDAWLGEPRRWHPLVGFGRYALAVERRCYGRERWRGGLAVALAVLPWLGLAYFLARLPGIGAGLELLGLYCAVGRRSLGQHARPVALALQQGDLAEARRRVSWLVSRDTAELSPGEVAKACVESVLENGCDAVVGALFWFAVAGLPGVVLYRLVNTLDAMWGYKNDRYQAFGWAAARLDDGLNYLPARATALAYCLAGRTGLGWRCWRSQAAAWKSPNAGPVMAAGAGALAVRLGGAASYGGQRQQRPLLGEGAEPEARHIEQALRLLDRALLLLLLAMPAGGWLLA